MELSGRQQDWWNAVELAAGIATGIDHEKPFASSILCILLLTSDSELGNQKQSCCHNAAIGSRVTFLEFRTNFKLKCLQNVGKTERILKCIRSSIGQQQSPNLISKRRNETTESFVNYSQLWQLRWGHRTVPKWVKRMSVGVHLFKCWHANDSKSFRNRGDDGIQGELLAWAAVMRSHAQTSSLLINTQLA